MVKHERTLLFNDLLATAGNIVVCADKVHFYFADNNGVALTGLLPVKGMRIQSKATPAAQVRKGSVFGLNTTLAVNTRYMLQVENGSMSYYSHRAANGVYPSVTPVVGDAPALKSALYSDLVRRIGLDNRAIVNPYVVYKITVAHTAAVTPTLDSAVSQAGEAAFSAKYLYGAFANGASTLYVYALAGTMNTAKAITIGATTSSGTTPTIEVAGIYMEDKYDYGSFQTPNKNQLLPSTFLSALLDEIVIKEGVVPVGQGSVLARDAQVMTPGNLDMMYGNPAYNFSSTPSAAKTYNIYSVEVDSNAPEGEMGDGAKPNIRCVYLVYADTTDGAKLTAFENKLTEAALSA